MLLLEKLLTPLAALLQIPVGVLMFGALMLFSTIRYWWKGWIVEILLKPDFHFTYWGFSWVQPFPEKGM